MAFCCFAPHTMIVSVPLRNIDVPFAFQDVTAHFQQATIQGILTHRITDPRRRRARFQPGTRRHLSHRRPQTAWRAARRHAGRGLAIPTLTSGGVLPRRDAKRDRDGERARRGKTCTHAGPVGVNPAARRRGVVPSAQTGRFFHSRAITWVLGGGISRLGRIIRRAATFARGVPPSRWFSGRVARRMRRSRRWGAWAQCNGQSGPRCRLGGTGWLGLVD